MKNLLRDAFPANSTLRSKMLRRAADRCKLYVIFFTPRSGSTWLTELAMNTAGLGTPQEWFNDGWIYTDQTALGCKPPRLRDTLDVNDYVDAVVDEGKGVVGLELSVFQALMLRELIDGPFESGWLHASFYLRRRDLLAQAVSLYRSAVSTRFHSYQNTPDQICAFNSVEYSRDKLLQWLRFLIECERRFAVLFRRAALSPVTLFYEDLAVDPLRVLRYLAETLGVPSPQCLPPSALTIMRDNLSTTWYNRLVRDLPSELMFLLRSRDALFREGPAVHCSTTTLVMKRMMTGITSCAKG